MRIYVRLTPRAASNSIEGFDTNGVLKARITAAPADGAANKAITRLLAKTLRLPLRDVVLVSGATSRDKVFEIAATDEDIRQLINAANSPKPQP